MAARDRVITSAVACPHCGGAIELQTFKTKRRKFLIVFKDLDAKGPCPHCNRLVRVKMNILKGREKKQETAPVIGGEPNE